MDAKKGSSNFIAGLLVGAASWLPGISGGIVAVLFGIYERLIDDISNIRTKIREDFWFLVTVGFGILVGIVIIVFVLDYMMSAYLTATMFLFVCMIVGQLPELIRITKKGESVKRSHIVWLSLGFIFMMMFLFLELYYTSAVGEELIMASGTLNGVILSFVAGLVFALSKIVPGISGSTVLLALGLYGWLLAIMTGFDLKYLLPFGIGFVIGAIMFAKVMGHILAKYHHPVYYFMVGLASGSILVIIAVADVSRWIDVLVGLGAAIAGIVISLAFGIVKGPSKSVSR